MRRPSILSLCAVPMALLVAQCGGTNDTLPPGPWDDGAEIPYEAQPDGDPVAGFELLTTKGYVSCGVPLTRFPLLQSVLGDFASGPRLEDASGNPLRSGDNADMPYNWNVHTVQVDGQDTQIASLNCLQCHASYFNGEFHIGLGNVFGDYTGADILNPDFRPALVEVLNMDPQRGDELALKLFDRQAAIGWESTLPTVGSNPAVTLAVGLATFRDAETLAWNEERHHPRPPVQLPIDVPPWWRTAKKSTHFYNGMSRGPDHKGTMTLASMLCTDSNEEALEIMSYFDDIHAYIRSIQPPEYPFAVDEALASTGKRVFRDNCSGCHGTYGATDADDTYPNLLIPLDVIDTDPEMAAYETDLDEWFDKTVYAQYSQIEMASPFRGYTAPPLDGVWATPPFLHNGSVPDLESLLNSTTRPRYWKKPAVFDSTAFDEERIGWEYEVVDHGHAANPDDPGNKYIYDTTLPGHSNGGHRFGDELTPEERRAVIEYIKTI